MTIATPELHLCIATGQNLANLIPALQCKAREVWILQTPEMRARAGFLADALKARDIAVQRIDFADDDVTTLHAQAAGIAERLDGRAVTINLTGGTKLMTLALTDTLAEHLATGDAAAQPHMVYTDTKHHRLDWLGPRRAAKPWPTCCASTTSCWPRATGGRPPAAAPRPPSGSAAPSSASP